jgi:hypothetical protein
VDTIVEAAAAAGVDWTHFDVVTYRNNLNKVLLPAPMSLSGSWKECFKWARTPHSNGSALCTASSEAIPL